MSNDFGLIMHNSFTGELVNHWSPINITLLKPWKLIHCIHTEL